MSAEVPDLMLLPFEWGEELIEEKLQYRHDFA
jgi:hypothetical protein